MKTDKAETPQNTGNVEKLPVQKAHSPSRLKYYARIGFPIVQTIAQHEETDNATNQQLASA